MLNPAGTKILLIDHVALNRWLTPGGHYEGGALLESAMREVEEESGVTNAVLHPWLATHGIPLDIDSHDIPQNPANLGRSWKQDIRGRANQLVRILGSMAISGDARHVQP